MILLYVYTEEHKTYSEYLKDYMQVGQYIAALCHQLQCHSISFTITTLPSLQVCLRGRSSDCV